MNKGFVRNSTGILKKVLLCPPDYMKLQPINVIANKWIEQNKGLDIEKCIEEHRELVSIYKENGIEVELMEPKEEITNEVFARDFGGCVYEGYILGKFKEKIRFRETEEYEKEMEKIGVPCVARVEKGIFEGGDFWFLDDNTLAIGTVARTNETGIQEIREGLNKFGYSVVPVKCPQENLHLDMCFNIVAEKMAVVCRRALPDSFIEILNKRGFMLIDIPQEGVFKHQCNLQSIGNGKVISLKSNTEVNRKLRANGLDVLELNASEILKSGGGPHCMTFPLIRI
ncbi:MAG: arginine deiminase family protein [Clostridium sp.]|jgi:N-dimethylarginine dimethylaminohydrolase|uniref:dimethylarginine dimethylaminohydrolase family protein n=1 Tax=Clostridium sp. TaxID=1506 RepID=UPI0025C14A14|nr:arginine deiminase family protein [Clostridium sp.]MCH3965412.1 arginine deiminase family protein [Clostridium sp.]MCI1717356.1 arginine deiminase family protein [Clostridium sp.]MCI1801696.1 arginine deiminase family protein [Clostridium sp.]MCI1815553.1 arginine deiminase family protein [Clostridium sp.]MCI1872456.1 arginine deiminase family protein [Clostridium sp.]